MEFVTRKISNTVARVKLGMEREIVLGNLEAKRDWGYAPEYVEAMWLVLQHDKPDDFVVATGETHSVREFVDEAFRQVGLDPTEFVKTDRLFMRPKDVDLLCGDCSKINNELGWQPKTTFQELVKIMVEADLNRWSGYLNGNSLPWDAPNYPGDIRLLKRHL